MAKAKTDAAGATPEEGSLTPLAPGESPSPSGGEGSVFGRGVLSEARRVGFGKNEAPGRARKRARCDGACNVAQPSPAVSAFVAQREPGT